MQKFSEEIETGSNLLLETTLQQLFIASDLKLRTYPYHKEKGIDYNFEIENREDRPVTIGMFFVQNKGVDSKIEPLVKGNHKGKISFKLDDFRQVEYFCSQLEQPLIITICDLETHSIYWEAIQLSSEEYLERVQSIKVDLKNKKRKGESIQVYLKPENTLLKNSKLCLENFLKFSLDIENSKKYLAARYFTRNNTFDETAETIEVDQSLHILDQLYSYLTIRFKEVVSLPAKFWASSYPFKTTKKSYFINYQFSIQTDNEILFELIDSISIYDKYIIEFNNPVLIEGVDDYKQKTEKILSILNYNLVFEITLHKTGRKKNIRYSKNKHCECIQCSFNRLRFDKVFQHFLHKTNNLWELDKQAYIFYKLGKFIKSAQLFLKANKIAAKENLYLKSFIIKFNLSKLANLVKYSFSGETVDNKLLKELDAVRNELELDVLMKPNDRKILKWLKSGAFFNEYNNEVVENSIKIKDHYYSQLYGGRGSNSYVWEAYSQHALLDSFLDYNHIIYDLYSEYKQHTEVYIEALLTSYAIHESLYSRLEKFDDWIIRILIFHANPDTIKKYCNRYSIKKINYATNAKDGDGYMGFVRNFFLYDKHIENYLEEGEWEANFYFSEKYNTILSNLLVLAYFLNVTESEINEMAILLKDFILRSVTINYSRSTKYIVQFLGKKGKFFTNQILIDFFNLIFQSPYVHTEDYLSTIAENFQKKKLGIELTNTQRTQIEQQFKSVCPICKRKHDSSQLVYYFLIVEHLKDKETIKHRILATLNDNFDWRLYYSSAIHEILGIDNQFFLKFIDYVKPSVERPSFFTNSRDEENRDFRLGAIINLCFKYNVNLKTDRFNQLKGFDPYYDWLLDMEGFDYSYFNPRWVSEYGTVFYFEKMKPYKQIQQKVYDYLKNNNDPLLKNNYILIFGSID